MCTRRIVFESPARCDDDYVVVRSYIRKKPATPCYRTTFFRDDVADRIFPYNKELRNERDGSFHVLLDEDNVYLKELVEEAQNRGLTVSGDTTDCTKGGDITNAVRGDIITFGTSSRFDVNWVKRSRYACEKSFIPIHKISEWKTVMKALKAFAKEKKELLDEVRYYGNKTPLFKELKSSVRKTYGGCGSVNNKVYELEDCRGIRGRLHDDFVKVGFDFYRTEKPCRKVEDPYLVLIR